MQHLELLDITSPPSTILSVNYDEIKNGVERRKRIYEAINVYLVLILFPIVFSGCTPSECNVDYESHLNPEDPPYIYITSKESNCIYNFTGSFWLTEINFQSYGEMHFVDNAIFLKIEEINSTAVKYFDFTKEVNEKYHITFNQNNSDLSKSIVFNAQIEKIVTMMSGINVYVFRIDRAFIYEGYYFDLVYFVSKENGVIGSYVSNFKNGVERVIEPAGNILRKEI